MRVQGLTKGSDGWAIFEYKTTYGYGWESCLAYVETIYQYTEQVQIFVAPIAGAKMTKIEINGIDDIKTIQESGVIDIRGISKIYKGAMCQIIFFNQTNFVRLCMPTMYIESLRKNKTDFYNEEEQKHIFDKFMDSIELNGQTKLVKNKSIKDTVNQIETAFNQYEELHSKDGSDVVLRFDGDASINLTEIVNKIKDK